MPVRWAPGSICKLVHQMINSTISQAIAEGLTLGVKAGVDTKALWECVRRGMVGRMHVLHVQVPQTVFRNNFATETFPFKLLRKDVGLATALGRELNVPLPLANIAEQNLIEAINRGWGDKSAYTVTFQLQEEAAQVALRAEGVDPQQAAKYISTNPDGMSVKSFKPPIVQTSSEAWPAGGDPRRLERFERFERLELPEVNMAKHGFKVLDSDMHILEPPISGSATSTRNSNTSRPSARPTTCATCVWSARTAEPGVAPPIRRREHFRRPVIFFTRIRNSFKLTTSAAGRRKFSSTPWRKKESIWRFSIRAAG